MDNIASFLKTNTEAMISFEKKYKDNLLNIISDNFFEISSPQAKEINKKDISLTAEELKKLDSIKVNKSTSTSTE